MILYDIQSEGDRPEHIVTVTATLGERRSRCSTSNAIIQDARAHGIDTIEMIKATLSSVLETDG